VFRRRDESTLHGVIVEIVQLLPHHLVISHFLRMRSFLPYLMRALPLVFRAEVLELIQYPLHVFLLQLLQNALCGVPLEISQNAREIRGGNNGVDVIIEDHPRVNFQAFAQATIFE